MSSQVTQYWEQSHHVRFCATRFQSPPTVAVTEFPPRQAARHLRLAVSPLPSVLLLPSADFPLPRPPHLPSVLLLPSAACPLPLAPRRPSLSARTPSRCRRAYGHIDRKRLPEFHVRSYPRRGALSTAEPSRLSRQRPACRPMTRGSAPREYASDKARRFHLYTG